MVLRDRVGVGKGGMKMLLLLLLLVMVCSEGRKGSMAVAAMILGSVVAAAQERDGMMMG